MEQTSFPPEHAALAKCTHVQVLGRLQHIKRKIGVMPPHRPLINLKTFASVAASTGSSLETKYLPEFEAQLSKDFDLLRTHLLANSMKTSERLAHTCVGLCEIMGADALSKELRRIEQGCRTDAPMSLYALTDNLHLTLRDTCSQMQMILKHMDS